MRLATAAALVAVSASALMSPAAIAQAYPSRPIRLIVPQTPSGQVDTIGRTLAQHFAEKLGQPWIVENRAGANGAIGFEAAAKSAPDGYTLLMSNQSGLVFAPALKKSLPYDPLADFTSLGMLFDAPYYLLVHPSVPARTVTELIALARAQPGKLNYASVGVGSGQHLFTEMLKSATGMDLVHVPYKGSTQAGTDLVAGSVQVMLNGSGFTLPQAKGGKVRVLASTGSQRTVAMPELPTLMEAGVPGFSASTWYSMSGPAKLPRALVQKLNGDMLEALKGGPVRQKLVELDMIVLPGPPEELTERVRRELPVFAKAVRDAGVEPE